MSASDDSKQVAVATQPSKEIAVSSPYYLHPSDNPRSVISGVQLNGENYSEWATELENALRAKRKTCFIDGTLPAPSTTSEDYDQWRTVNSMIVGWIRSSISLKIRSTVTFTPEAYKLWVDLKKRFAVGNSVRVYQLKAELVACRQEGLSVLDYYGKLSSKWEELNNYKPIRHCSCGGTSPYVKEREEEQVYQFLMGLDESRFGNICTTIIGTDPLPDVNEIYQKIVREERRLNSLRNEHKPDAVGFATRSETHSEATTLSPPLAAATRTRERVPSCSHCGRRGHEKTKCWQIVGFPEWWSEKYQGAPPGGRGRGSERGSSSGRGRGTPQFRANTAKKTSPLPNFTPDQMESLLEDMVSCPINFADGSQVFARQYGVLTLSKKISLQNVLLDRFTRTLIGAGEERDGVYVYRDVTAARVHKAQVVEDKTLWHRRLGHPSFQVLSFLPLVFGVGVESSTRQLSECEIYFKSKQTRAVFFDSINKASECFSLIHVDVWGPYRVPSSSGANYFLTIVDDHSREVWTYLLLEKSEVKIVLQNFCHMSERQFGKQVKIVRSDNGTEFMCLEEFFAEKGIAHETSCVATPQQNDRVERKHRHILNVARLFMFQAHLPIKFWGDCVLAATHVINRTPSTILHGKSPYEILFGVPPLYEDLKVIGCLCYAHKVARDKDKFGTRSRKCVFVGYPFGKKGWKVYDLEANEFFVSRDVAFYEEKFPFEQKQSPSLLILEQGTPVQIADVFRDTEVSQSYVEEESPVERSPPVPVETEEAETSSPVPVETEEAETSSPEKMKRKKLQLGFFVPPVRTVG
ncbi:PREDICTED: uncharacterized protein LOC109127039 [Camelina sativa]|uniref:Uncharacterized protein LOC109127039 n=1 Tax=Camelina sativa TaxID=90675 RepID=A0ABM1QIX7_CAMSA|nr:PREDICTED: uncharacterized protein LOC109127039 [Camelina sativa]